MTWLQKQLESMVAGIEICSSTSSEIQVQVQVPG